MSPEDIEALRREAELLSLRLSKLETIAERNVKRDDLIVNLGPGSFAQYVRRAWAVVEGRELTWGRALDIMCSELEAVSPGNRKTTKPPTKRVVICVPPGFAKSLLTAVFLPTYRWLCDPSERVLSLSALGSVSTRDNGKARDLVSSEWYQSLFKRIHGKDFELRSDNNAKTSFANKLKGSRNSSTIGAGITGLRADGIILDDLLDATLVSKLSPGQIAMRCEKIRDIINNAIRSRLNDPADSWIVCIGQRLCDGDPPSVFLAKDNVRKIVLPMVYDPEIPHLHEDDTRKPGEPLFPERFPMEWVEETRRDMIERHYMAQYQQTPGVGRGGIFRRAWMCNWFRFCQPRHWERGTTWISLDATFKGGKNSDFVAFSVIGMKDGHFYVLDVVHDQMTFTETLHALRILVAKWRDSLRGLIIEDKANGPAIVDSLKKAAWLRVPVKEFNPGSYGSKEARAEVSSVQWERGAVHLPEDAEWLADFTKEHLAFPAAPHDDQVDSVSMAILYLEDHYGDQLEKVRRMYDSTDTITDMLSDLLGSGIA